MIAVIESDDAGPMSCAVFPDRATAVSYAADVGCENSDYPRAAIVAELERPGFHHVGEFEAGGWRVTLLLVHQP